MWPNHLSTSLHLKNGGWKMIVSFCDGFVASAIAVLADGGGGLPCKILRRVKCSQNSGYRNHEDAVPTDLLMNVPFFWILLGCHGISMYFIICHPKICESQKLPASQSWFLMRWSISWFRWSCALGRLGEKPSDLLPLKSDHSFGVSFAT